MEEDVNIKGLPIRPHKIKQEKLQLFLNDTESAVPNGIYIKKCLGVLKRTIYINKDVLKLRVQPLNQRTVILSWPYLKEAHKKQCVKDKQGNAEANSVMQLMANKIGALKRLTDK